MKPLQNRFPSDKPLRPGTAHPSGPSSSFCFLELFAGSGNLSDTFRAAGHEALTVDMNPDLSPDVVADVSKLRPRDLPSGFRSGAVVWASPPCPAFSVAAIGRHWTRDHQPKTDQARAAVELVRATRELIAALNPRFFFIENPRGKLRKLPVVGGLPRATVTLCAYGDPAQKPTDIWTDALSVWTPRPMCRPGASCHARAPRGSKTPGSTQGKSGAYERAIMPADLARDIIKALEGRSRSKLHDFER